MKNHILVCGVALILTACGGGGSSPSTPQVAVTPAPTVQITLSAPKIYINDTVKVSWTSTNATSCTGSDGFAGVQPTSGTTNFTPTVGGQFKYTLTCTGAGGNAVHTQTVTSEDPIKTFSGAQSVSLVKDWNVDGNYMPEVGIFRFNTGLWAPTRALSYSFNLTGAVDIRSSTITTAQFTWDAVAAQVVGVVAFNNVTIGKHPGVPTSSSTKFPVQVGSMPIINVNGDMKTVCITVCAYGSIMNAFTMSTPNPTQTDLSALSNIGTEFLVVTENSDGGPNPNIPGYVGNSIISGVEYKVYYNAFKSTWNNIGYSPLKQSSSVNINLKDLMQDAINRGYIKSTDYLMSVEFGTEVVFGKGSTTYTNVTVN